MTCKSQRSCDYAPSSCHVDIVTFFNSTMRRSTTLISSIKSLSWVLWQQKRDIFPMSATLALVINMAVRSKQSLEFESGVVYLFLSCCSKDSYWFVIITQQYFFYNLRLKAPQDSLGKAASYPPAHCELVQLERQRAS